MAVLWIGVVRANDFKEAGLSMKLQYYAGRLRMKGNS